MSLTIRFSNDYSNQEKLPSMTKELPPIRMRNFRGQSWNLIQQRVYTSFLKENLQTMKTIRQRKSFRPFKRIADILRTRNSIQVKSHHQKLLQKFGSLEVIIAKMEEYLEETSKTCQQSMQQLFEGIVFENFKPCLTFALCDPSIKIETQRLDQNLILFEENNHKVIYKIHCGEPQ